MFFNKITGPWNIWLYSPLGYEIFSEKFVKPSAPPPTYLWNQGNYVYCLNFIFTVRFFLWAAMFDSRYSKNNNSNKKSVRSYSRSEQVSTFPSRNFAIFLYNSRKARIMRQWQCFFNNLFSNLKYWSKFFYLPRKVSHLQFKAN